MRTREEIENEIDPPWTPKEIEEGVRVNQHITPDRVREVTLEVLLDIRDLLTKQ